MSFFYLVTGPPGLPGLYVMNYRIMIQIVQVQCTVSALFCAFLCVSAPGSHRIHRLPPFIRFAWTHRANHLFTNYMDRKNSYGYDKCSCRYHKISLFTRWTCQNRLIITIKNTLTPIYGGHTFQKVPVLTFNASAKTLAVSY